MSKHADTYRKIGLKIGYYRRLKGLTQEQLSEKLSISTHHIGSMEAPNVARTMSLTTLLDIAELLEVPAYKFFLFDDEEDSGRVHYT